MRITTDDIRAVRDRWSDPVAKEILDDLIAEFEEGDEYQRNSPESSALQDRSRNASSTSNPGIYGIVVAGQNSERTWDIIEPTQSVA